MLTPTLSAHAYVLVILAPVDYLCTAVAVPFSAERLAIVHGFNINAFWYRGIHMLWFFNLRKSLKQWPKFFTPVLLAVVGFAKPLGFCIPATKHISTLTSVRTPKWS
jgi:hypothetical protein